jgi:STE24 endopeptidase
MTPQLLFIIFVSILVLNFILEQTANYLNSKHFNDSVPDDLKEVYTADKYRKSQLYKQANYRFDLVQSTFSFTVLILFIFLDGFKYLDDFVRNISNNTLIISLLYFGIIYISNTVIALPFSYYHNFVIEERFGFNKMTKALFVKDTLKSLVLSVIIGGVVLVVILWFYQLFPTTFWIYTWVFIAVFSLFMNLFYTKLIVPLFNKLIPLEEGSLKTTLEAFAKKVNFNLKAIFLIDGSKRSTKANAYFSGFGKTKKVVLYDTLLKDLSDDEIAAILAHEIGHYKKKHIVYNMILSILLTGFTLYLLSLFINEPILAQALGIQQPSFHIGFIIFMVLYTPISVLTGLLMNILSRKFEYQADNYAKEFGYAKHLILALKKLSATSLGNLTPHKFYIFLNYSHPTLLQRIQNLKQKQV